MHLPVKLVCLKSENISSLFSLWHHYEFTGKRSVKFENNKRFIRMRKYKTVYTMVKRTNSKWFTQKTKYWQHEFHTKLGMKLRYSSNFRSTDDTSPVILVTKPMMSPEWGNDGIVITTNETYSWSIKLFQPYPIHIIVLLRQFQFPSTVPFQCNLFTYQIHCL